MQTGYKPPIPYRSTEVRIWKRPINKTRIGLILVHFSSNIGRAEIEVEKNLLHHLNGTVSAFLGATKLVRVIDCRWIKHKANCNKSVPRRVDRVDHVVRKIDSSAATDL